jgi:hypothetical protein
MDENFWNACNRGQIMARLFLWGIAICLAGPGMGPPSTDNHGSLLWATAVIGFVVDFWSAWADFI